MSERAKKGKEDQARVEKTGEQQPALNLPNMLSLLRICFIPVLIIFMLLEARQPDQTWNVYAALFFLIGIATDPLDGWIARKKNLITDVGKLLDPLADKLLVISSLVLMVEAGWIPAWIVIIIIGRALAVTGLRGIASSQGIVIHASLWGKLKTLTQTLAVTLLFLHTSFSLFNFTAQQFGIYVLYLALLLTIISGSNYFYQFFAHR